MKNPQGKLTCYLGTKDKYYIPEVKIPETLSSEDDSSSDSDDDSSDENNKRKRRKRGKNG